MKYIIPITAWVGFILLLVILIIFFSLMHFQRKKISTQDFGNSPKLIVNRYFIWYFSFTLWTIIDYVLTLTPLFTSVSAIYFSADIILNEASKSSAVYLTIFSLLSALFPLINEKIHPKLHTRGFYKGLTLLEQAMMKYGRDMITEEELFNIFRDAEKATSSIHLDIY